MTDLVYDYISMGVDMMISAAILASIVILMRSSTMLSSYSAQQQATTDRLNYYKEYSVYDNTSGLSVADVLSAVEYYKYDLTIVINSGGYLYTIKDGVYKRTLISNGSTATITRDVFIGCMGTSGKYKAKLYEDFSQTSNEYYQGGVITGIQFTRQ